MFQALELAQCATLRWAANLEALGRTSAKFPDASKSRDVDRMTEANQDFRVAIGCACRNKYVAGLYETQLAISLRLARLVFAQAPLSGRFYRSYYVEVVPKHAAMIAAIKEKDARAADRLARDHADLFRSRVVEHMQSSPAGDLPMD